MHAFAFPSLTLMHTIRSVVMRGGAARLPVRWSLRVEITADGDLDALLRKLRGESGVDDLAQHIGHSGLALGGGVSSGNAGVDEVAARAGLDAQGDFNHAPERCRSWAADASTA